MYRLYIYIFLILLFFISLNLFFFSKLRLHLYIKYSFKNSFTSLQILLTSIQIRIKLYTHKLKHHFFLTNKTKNLFFVFIIGLKHIVKDSFIKLFLKLCKCSYRIYIYIFIYTNVLNVQKEN